MLSVLVTLIRTLREALGITTIVVSHDIPETLQIADYIYIIANILNTPFAVKIHIP